MPASYGTFGKFGIGTTSTVTNRLQYKQESFIRSDDAYDGNALRGTRSSSIELVRDGIQRVGGPVTLVPTPLELAGLLAWIMGGTPTGSPTVSYPLGEAIGTLFVAIDRVAKVFVYSGVAVDVATFKATKGGNLELTLNLVGQSVTEGNAGTFPALSLDITTFPFVFTDLVLTVGGTTVTANDFTLTINNRIDKDRFLNSLTLSAVNSMDREVQFATSVPYGDFFALHTAMTAGPVGLAATATFTVGGSVLTFTLPAVSLPRQNPTTPGRSELFLPLEGRAYRRGANLELVTTLNPGP